jgi:hypothetical protein
MQRKILPFVLAIAAAAGVAGPQQPPARAVDSPYQEGVSYSLGEELALDVDIEGIWWTHVQIESETGETVDVDAEVDVVAKVRFDNRAGRTVRLATVLMLEDGSEQPLERLQFPSFKLPARRVREFQHRFSVSGSDLIATRHLYLFCKIE